MSKAALLHIVSIWYSFLAHHQIRVNGIAPGMFHSDMIAPAYQRLGIQGTGVTDGSFPATHIPLTRGGGEMDIAGLVLWMTSFSGGYLNGETIVLDGGEGWLLYELVYLLLLNLFRLLLYLATIEQ